MKTDISSNGNSVGLARSQSFTSRMLGIVFAVGVSACAVYAAANGPALWSGAQQRKAEQVQQENEMFCERFRMPPGGEFRNLRWLFVGNQEAAWGQTSRLRLPVYSRGSRKNCVQSGHMAMLP